MQAETYCGIQPLTDEEIQNLIQCEAADMDAETTVKFVNDLIDAGSEETKECTHIEKIVWIVRHAYLSGFLKGVEIYNDVVRKSLEER